ncbi:nucleoside-diphosphate-sugar epimerase [Herbihabitans rhizosphaerae]|uniref:Nucleoside-diphosphate-sugar epimerase n=1 Tax=Herbihabitans rhizosphaerae TaxID=1872711 RepID=A0A4Q7KG21_9PSEU|nr:NAD(P)-dependent oxidoreductase [Herbihabitans rhizosphaerae]RZS34019.1 nucleoside-diphosphate-sugar epimerase [Herbihabitans rhizosphaerae]
MRVLLIGSTGVLGREAAPRLLAAGHQVTGLARNDGRVPAVRALGLEPVVADVFDVESMTAATRGQDAVINLATRIPSRLRGAFAAFKETVRLREEATGTIAEAARASGDVRIIVQEGVSFVYASGGDTELDEDARLDVPKLMRSAVTAHDNVLAFARDGRTGVGLRIGLLTGDDALSRILVRATRRGFPSVPGSPDAWTTLIHPSDAAAAAVAALDAPTGVYNVGADPIRKRDHGAMLAEAAGRSTARHLPSALASYLGRSHRVVSHKLTEATGWRPERPKPSADWYPGS